MNEQQREQIIQNAKYLQKVRPIDPEEIYEYVEGTPHPATVRQVLREQASRLGLLERTDGCFEPVTEESLSVAFHGVDAVPENIPRAIEDVLVERFGPGWPDGSSGETLRSSIRGFKQQYLDGASVTYDEDTALGYAVYHLPAYFATVQYVLADLLDDGLLPKHLRILDIGAGVGGPALGIDAIVGDSALVEYHAIEPSASADLLERLLDLTGRNFHSRVHRIPVEEFDPMTALASPNGERNSDETDSPPFDVILFGNVLSELADPAQVLVESFSWLTSDGTVVALAPADRNTATGLRGVERLAEQQGGATVYAPTVRLWPNERPESESWSFRRHHDLAVPSFQRRLDEGERTESERTAENQPAGSGEFVNVDVQYAYSLLRCDEQTAVTARPSRSRVAKMADSDQHVTDRVDYAALKLSHDLAESGNPLFLVADGSQMVDHFAVLTSESALNRDLLTAEYGDLLLLERVLVLWNDDESAYNLVVDEESIVERIPS